MSDDERQIRELVQRWMAATKAGDIQTVLSLMSEDVVFLIPGQPPMNKEAFAAASEQSKAGAVEFEGVSEIQEVQVVGDWAFMWTRLKVIARPAGGRPPIMRAGHTLSVLRKEKGRWVLARDANLLAPVKEGEIRP